MFWMQVLKYQVCDLQEFVYLVFYPFNSHFIQFCAVYFKYFKIHLF